VKLHWSWMFVALVLGAGALAFLLANLLQGTAVRTGSDAEIAARDAATSTTGTAASAVHDYVQFAEGLGDGRIGKSALEPAAIAEGLRKLAVVLGALQLGDPDLPVDLRITAEHVLLNPASPATTAAVRAGLLRVAAAIGMERQDTAASLIQAAEAIDGAAPLVSQQAPVRQFLRQSAGVLEHIRV
jgi:hypothetical protein